MSRRRSGNSSHRKCGRTRSGNCRSLADSQCLEAGWPGGPSGSRRCRTAFRRIALRGGGGGNPILWTAAVLRQCPDHGLSLHLIVAAAARTLQVGHRAINARAVLRDLVAKCRALRWLVGEEGKQSRSLAAEPLPLRLEAIEIALLPVQYVLKAPGLLGTCRIACTAVDRRKLRLKPTTHRVDGGAGHALGCYAGGRCQHQKSCRNAPAWECPSHHRPPAGKPHMGSSDPQIMTEI